uniref:Uncharacterized protein n=1 Tax=Leptospirillum sp. Group II '5-way CG' TaxID=419541 RepID=B6AQY0_9BACT|nr:MAG: Hypothetical protein CGL2_10822019 [Leptospirillum sp. Group II '5-way CG']
MRYMKIRTKILLRIYRGSEALPPEGGGLLPPKEKVPPRPDFIFR